MVQPADRGHVRPCGPVSGPGHDVWRIRNQPQTVPLKRLGGRPSTLAILDSTIVNNGADGGAAGAGGSQGLGSGGGLYVTPGSIACADLLTVIHANHASTSDDDVFGTLGSC